MQEQGYIVKMNDKYISDCVEGGEVLTCDKEEAIYFGNGKEACEFMIEEFNMYFEGYTLVEYNIGEFE